MPSTRARLNPLSIVVALLAALLGGLLLAAPAAAAPNPTVTVTVEDAGGPLNSVTVLVTSVDDDSFEEWRDTDTLGKAVYVNVPPGRYSLFVAPYGYVGFEHGFDVRAPISTSR